MNNYSKNDVIEILEKIGIDFNYVSESTLESIVGEELDYNILMHIITNAMSTWERLCKDFKPQSYKFTVLKTLVKYNYHFIKHVRGTGDEYTLQDAHVVVDIDNDVEGFIVQGVRNYFGDTWQTFKLDKNFVIEALKREAIRRKNINDLGE